MVYYEAGQYRRISYVRVENERWLLFPSGPRKSIWLAKVRTLHVLGYHPRVAAGIPRCRHVCRYIVCMCLRSDLIVRRGHESEVHIALIFPRGCDKQSAECFETIEHCYSTTEVGRQRGGSSGKNSPCACCMCKTSLPPHRSHHRPQSMNPPCISKTSLAVGSGWCG